ncbi:uncharacterized protein PGTG_02048 [Puccinia graminis f. sp. tritici CRL 75-36-700-3]|uniref:Uncharacterized protein n=1 Tax=Puccinia graminis f. sp. tritici (strain CRL 75-36-700-3 / race SCCL) TaxID=418459 RepID=E3JX12_PUCGT|nr:uncharacterized protein PGTG_02048 [Puccinia graminis f. sp. tritici CRL 75-36-700-3]EFP76587.1 hypothetical protein PGTG_02048 [Puccinia graminis f. sp. tritici CRL 75-36-700-3]
MALVTCHSFKQFPGHHQPPAVHVKGVLLSKSSSVCSTFTSGGWKCPGHLLKVWCPHLRDLQSCPHLFSTFANGKHISLMNNDDCSIANFRCHTVQNVGCRMKQENCSHKKDKLNATQGRKIKKNME